MLDWPMILPHNFELRAAASWDMMVCTSGVYIIHKSSKVGAMARHGHLDMLVADWDMVPGYWRNFFARTPATLQAKKMSTSIPCTLYCF